MTEDASVARIGPGAAEGASLDPNLAETPRAPLGPPDPLVREEPEPQALGLERLHARIDALEKHNAELQRSNQELDEFTHIVAHDLKEPLRGIQTYASLLLDDYGNVVNAAGRSRLEALRQLADRLHQRLEALLEFSRVGRVDLAIRDVDLNQVVNRALFSLGFALEERGVAVRVPRPLPTVRCDPHRVAEVYANLVSNAAKYNDKASKWIEIGWNEEGLLPTNLAETPSPSSLPLPCDPSLPVFYVRDNGIGIEPRDLATVFRVFKRLPGSDAYGSGSGMGLTLVKRIIERHGGSIWVESAFQEGTTFFFTLEPGTVKGGRQAW
jgi:two-component system, chemotaxis family, sensor kinase Cph1